MTFSPITLKGRGRLSEAIRELDARTRGSVVADTPNALVSRTTRAVIIIPSAGSTSGRRPIPQRPVWG